MGASLQDGSISAAVVLPAASGGGVVVVCVGCSGCSRAPGAAPAPLARCHPFESVGAEPTERRGKRLSAAETSGLANNNLPPGRRERSFMNVCKAPSGLGGRRCARGLAPREPGRRPLGECGPWGRHPLSSGGAEPRGGCGGRGAEPARCRGRAGLWLCWIPLPSCPNHGPSWLVGESRGGKGRCVAGSGCK